METENKKEEKKKESEEEKKYPAGEQGITPNETSEEKEADMEHGEKDEDIYTKEGREKLEEDSEIDSVEAGFMEGASQAGQLGKDALTGETLTSEDDVYEAEIDGKLYRFKNEDNAKEFRMKREKEKL